MVFRLGVLLGNLSVDFGKGAQRIDRNQWLNCLFAGRIEGESPEH
ncbi:hypothetical protein [Adhaeribacter aquaticus]|nr:hypothetical protein [Adhaeribacter aquaticus]